MRLRVVDFETTGIPPDAEVVEAGFVDVVDWAGGWLIDCAWSAIVCSSRPVGVEARAAHHLTDAEIAAGMPWAEARAVLEANAPDAFVAHNADFEKAFFLPDGSRWIDTWKAALVLWPEAPRHSNQVLRYWLEGCDPGALGMPPHRALPDCHVTARVLMRCLERAELSDLFTYSAEVEALPTVPIGKHRGMKWAEVPAGWLEWATKQDFDGGMKAAIERELRRRRTVRR